MIPYHSAIKTELTQETATHVDLPRGSQAFVHDIFEPLPAAFATCDVLYAEPAWRPGYDEFNRRAGVINAPPYREYMAAIGRAIEAATVPTFLVLGYHAVKLVPAPSQRLIVELDVHKYRTPLFVYGTVAPEPVTTQTALLRALAERYHRVGDFCCGYGWTGRQFAQAGRAFVLSDVNAKCVGYIGTHGPAWFSGEAN